MMGAAPLFTLPSVDDDLDEGNHSDSYVHNCQHLAVAKLQAGVLMLISSPMYLIRSPSLTESDAAYNSDSPEDSASKCGDYAVPDCPAVIAVF